MTQAVGSTAVVPVKSALTSKINITQVIGLGTMLASYFGLPSDKVAAVVTTVGVAQGLVTWVMRTWFTKSVISSST